MQSARWSRLVPTSAPGHRLPSDTRQNARDEAGGAPFERRVARRVEASNDGSTQARRAEYHHDSPYSGEYGDGSRAQNELIGRKPAWILSLRDFLGHQRSKTPQKSKARLYAGFCAARRRAVAVIPLGRRSRAGSSHLPAASPSRIVGCLFGVAPRRDCPFHPPCLARTRLAGRLVSVALILTSRWTGVTCYAALWSPDVPLAGEPASDRPAGFAAAL